MDGSITVDMGQPILSPPERIPTTLESKGSAGAVVNAIIEAAGAQYEVTCVSVRYTLHQFQIYNNPSLHL